MVNEYHGKWKRNIILEFKNDFHYDVAMCHEPISYMGDVLCADVSKMIYVPSIIEYINRLATNPIDTKLGHWIYEVGTFLKDTKFAYENEQRFRVQLMSSDVMEQCHVGPVFEKLYGLQSLEEVYEKSIDMVKIIRGEYEKKSELIKDIKVYDSSSNTEYIVIGDINPNIVEKIYIFKNIADEDRRKVYKWASIYGIGIKELFLQK